MFSLGYWSFRLSLLNFLSELCMSKSQELCHDGGLARGKPSTREALPFHSQKLHSGKASPSLSLHRLSLPPGCGSPGSRTPLPPPATEARFLAGPAALEPVLACLQHSQGQASRV